MSSKDSGKKVFSQKEAKQMLDLFLKDTDHPPLLYTKKADSTTIHLVDKNAINKLGPEILEYEAATKVQALARGQQGRTEAKAGIATEALQEARQESQAVEFIINVKSTNQRSNAGEVKNHKSIKITMDDMDEKIPDEMYGTDLPSYIGRAGSETYYPNMTAREWINIKTHTFVPDNNKNWIFTVDEKSIKSKQAGGKKKSRKSRKARKSRKSRKTRKPKKSRKVRKGRKGKKSYKKH
tara:strand:+ start:37 stop:750 length:714 start_codon:yes stop_codon:yes gene_type:complete